MINTLKNFLGLGPKVNMGDLIAGGAQIIDVRTSREFASGHLKGSINIPLDQLHEQVKKLKGKGYPVITCCASGMRSASAKSFLTSNGFINVHNGGSWHSLKRHIK
jgi:phage shock protein E